MEAFLDQTSWFVCVHEDPSTTFPSIDLAHGCAIGLFTEATMVPSFIQKPIGAVTLLGTAIGAPYAIFETDAGTSARVVVQQWMNPASAPAAPSWAGDPNQIPAAPATAQINPFPTAGAWTVPTGTPMSGGAISPVANSYPVASYPGAGYPNAPVVPFGAVVSPVATPSPVTSASPAIPSVTGNGQVFLSSSALSPNSAGTQYGAGQQYGAGPQYGITSPNGITSAYGASVPAGNPALGSVAGTIQGPSLSGGEIHDLREVVRFDITPAQVTQRFSRVTTVLSNVQMDGLRVPVVTGTLPTDIAGTLTYYFDVNKAVQRIQLHGTTGDPSLIASLMVDYYRLKPEQSLGGQLFTTRWNNRVTSVMHVTPAPVIYAGATNARFAVFLELNQPSSQYALSEEASQTLGQTQATQRW